MTVSDISHTWVVQNLDNVVSSFLRSWLEFPISGTLNIVTLTKKRYGLNVVLPSARFMQCQVTYRNAQKKSVNADVREIHSVTSSGKNIIPDKYISTKEAMKAIRDKTIVDIEHLSTQSLVIKSIWNYALTSTNGIWFKIIENLPRSIYTFTHRYLGNCLPNRSNAIKWGIVQRSICNFCPENQTLGHVVSSCSQAFHEGRYTWRHNSILLSLSRAIAAMKDVTVYSDLPGFEFGSPSNITGEDYRPDMVAITDTSIFVMELTAGFETNIQKNGKRKAERYADLLKILGSNKVVRFLNLSMGATGVIGKDGSNIFKWLKELGFSEKETIYTVGKLVNVCIRTTFFLFCKRDEEWEKPDLLNW